MAEAVDPEIKETFLRALWINETWPGEIMVPAGAGRFAGGFALFASGDSSGFPAHALSYRSLENPYPMTRKAVDPDLSAGILEGSSFEQHP